MNTRWRAYVRNLVVMMLGAMPLGAIGLAIGVWLMVESQPADGLGETIAQAFLLVYVWGGLLAIPTSLVHTAVVRARARDTRVESLVLGLALGGIAGACTPTLLTGLLNPAAIAVGALIGVVYGATVHRPKDFAHASASGELRMNSRGDR